MKKGLSVLLCVVLLCGLCACGKGRAIRANNTTFLVEFHNTCEADIYTIHYEYYLGDTPIGGGEMGNADNSAIEPDDVLTKDFIKKDFPENADLRDFKLEIFATDHYKNEYPCDPVLPFEVEYGKTYSIELSGSFLDGFSVRTMEVNVNE